MNEYSKFVTYSSITSPVNGYECGRITKHNILKFGFNSIEELHQQYPSFPTSSQQYKDKQHKGVLERKNNIKEMYLKDPNRCKNCNTPLSHNIRNNKFCSSSCSAKYNNKKRGCRSNKTKLKISETLKNIERKPVSKTVCNIQSKICSICNNIFIIRNHSKHSRKTCSKFCKNQLIRLSAVSQEKHGSGKKGIYKGIRCDSTWELAYLIYHLDHNIKIERCTEKRQYIKNGVVRTYIPDFKTEQGIIEIKGFMSNTAKLKLLFNKDIIVIDKESIKKYIDYVKNTYKCQNIECLYDTKEYKVKIKNCVHCNEIFNVKSKKQKFCSAVCSKTHAKSETHRKRISYSLRHNR